MNWKALVVSLALLMPTGTGMMGEVFAYPTKPITLVVPFPPGGGTDTVGRPLASVANQHLGQPMVVIN